VDTDTIVTSDTSTTSTTSDYTVDNTDHTSNHTAVAVKSKKPWVIAFICAAIVLLVVEVWRGNDTAAVIAVVGVHLMALLGTCFKAPWSVVRRDAPRRWLRAFYVIGLVVGLWVIMSSSNRPVRIFVMVILCGLHAVAVAAFVTIGVQVKTKWADLNRIRLALWCVVAFGSLYLCVKADVRPKCGDSTGCHPARAYEVFSIGSGAYVFWIVLVSVVSGAFTWNYVHPRAKLQGAKAPTLYALLALGGFALGSMMVIATVVLTAWWRNNDPVEGPALYKLPQIPGITGDYVALGDSYSAGEGLTPFNAFTESNTAHLGNACHRSSQAFSQLLRFVGPTPAQRFVACSGAVTSDIFNQFTITDKDGNSIVVPPQVPPGEHPEVGLVTMTIGGNDVLFSSVVTHCFIRTDCLGTTFTPPPDNPARGIFLPPPAPLEDWAKQAIVKVKEKMDKLYPALRAAYPNARIVVIGYPYLFPDRDAPYWNLTDCQTILRRFNHDERVAVRGLQDTLNQQLHDSAAAANIEFISPAEGWKDHEPCGTSEKQYTNSIKPFILSSAAGFTPGDGGTFHPNTAGQKELAQLVTCYLVANTEPLDLAVGQAPPGSEKNPIPDCAEKS
jgi:GDSL-like Lipase/Acylhydrolase family